MGKLINVGILFAFDGACSRSGEGLVGAAATTSTWLVWRGGLVKKTPSPLGADHCSLRAGT